MNISLECLCSGLLCCLFIYQQFRFIIIKEISRSNIKSMPGKFLLILSAIALVITLLLPFTPFATMLGLVVPPLQLLLTMPGILILYVITADILKVIFFRKKIK